MSIIVKISQTVIDKTLYSTEVKNIETAMEEIRKEEDFKIVVFIDDLDRCSPIKALEILESIKVFLGIVGFIYVIGLSHQKISDLISIAYKKMGIDGKQYLKKIIQIPMIIPEWDKTGMKELLEDLLNDNKSLSNLKSNGYVKDLIIKAVEKNPRELKRFLNSFILSSEIYSLKRNSEIEIEINKLLCLLALKLRWEKIYSMKSPSILKRLIKYAQTKEQDKRHKEIDYDIKNDKRYTEDEKIIREIEFDTELWEFIRYTTKVLEKITETDWQLYRSAADTSTDKRIYDYDVRSHVNPRILWIDDHPNNNIGIMKKFEKDIIFKKAYDTEEAINYLKQNKYDCIISDLGRPSGADAGIKLIEKVREEGLDTSIIIYADDVSISKYGKRAKEAGAELVTDSPFELIKRLERLTKNE